MEETIVLGKLSERPNSSLAYADIYHQEILFRFAGTLFSTGPLSSLIGFILVPAHKRMVFESGADFFWSLFWGIALTTVLPLIASNSHVQYGVAMWIEGMENQTRNARAAPQFPRLGDEL